MKNKFKSLALIFSLLMLVFAGFSSCASDDSEDEGIEVAGTDDEEPEEEEPEEEEPEGEGPPDGGGPPGGDGGGDDGPVGDGLGSITELSSAFAEFSDAVTVTLSDDGTEIAIETTGLPNHTSIYWETDEELYVDEPTVTKTTQDTFIGGGTGEASSFIVDATPGLIGATVDTELNTIGIAVSGSAIFNDQEGMGALDDAAGSLDFNGAHKGPGVYHYHLEPRSITNDDEELVGILMDGVFIYGRQCNSTGTYPTDLDASGGHTSITQFEVEELYHYHIINELYAAPTYGYDDAIVLFAGPFQGY